MLLLLLFIYDTGAESTGARGIRAASSAAAFYANKCSRDAEIRSGSSAAAPEAFVESALLADVRNCK